MRRVDGRTTYTTAPLRVAGCGEDNAVIVAVRPSYHVVSYDAADNRGIHLTYSSPSTALKNATRLRLLLKSMKGWGPVFVFSAHEEEGEQ